MSGGTYTQKSFAKRLLGKPAAVISGAWLLIIATAALFPTLFTNKDPQEQDLFGILAGPGTKGHFLGTDELGRDLFARLVHGTRWTAWGSIVALTVAVILGVTLGLCAGFLGGKVDMIIQRFAEILFSIPALIILLVVYSVFPFNVVVAMGTLGVIFSSSLSRLVRGVTMTTREELFVSAAQVSGLSKRQIIFRHLLPRISSLVIVQASLLASITVLIQSSLAFLGFGPKAPRPSWGGLIANAKDNITRQSWLLVPPGVIVAITVIALNIFGDALRDTATERWSISKLKRRGRKAVGGLTYTPTPITDAAGALLSVQHLSVAFPGDDGPAPVVTDVSFHIAPGEVLGIVGESGCGKSMTASGILGMIPGRGAVTGGAVLFNGQNLTTMTPVELEVIRGRQIGFVSQEPMVALDPTWRVGRQLAEAVAHHRGVSKSESRRIAVELLEAVNLPTPAEMARRYPHQVSGGQAQRIAIAFALAGNPSLLIADEPTTALDVTIQAEILTLLRKIGAERQMAIMLITHNWGVVAELCDRAVVMYAGEVVETATVSEMFHGPLHPYTQGLLRSNPHLATKGDRLPTIAGSVPLPSEWPSGCRFEARCVHATAECGAGTVELTNPLPGRNVRCIKVDSMLSELGLSESGLTDPKLSAQMVESAS
jgi:peptide/nickel transport system permease protein